MNCILLLLLGCIPKINDIGKNGIISIKEILLVCPDSHPDNCDVGLSSSLGSATRISWHGQYYWLTAGHVCMASEEIPNSVSVEKMISITEAGTGKKYEAEKIVFDLKKDLCLLSAEKGPYRVLAESEPILGSDVQTVAYPGGAFDPNIYPIYDGRWAGRMNEENRCVVTIPVAGGSSGASIVNQKGQVVGVVSSVMKSFNHFTLTTCLDDVRAFVKESSDQLK
jgi:hypothetical protein